ncbi:MAG: hypothetical protein Greene101449_1291, partial [Candidatus Peregrinibacteria bacterium Greene1014_49]
MKDVARFCISVMAQGNEESSPFVACTSSVLVIASLMIAEYSQTHLSQAIFPRNMGLWVAVSYTIPLRSYRAGNHLSLGKISRGSRVSQVFAKATACR